MIVRQFISWVRTAPAGGAQLPPGTYLNGVPGRQSPPGLNGLPSFSNRTYHFGCYSNCGPARGRNRSGSYVGFVPLFSGFTFPSYVSGFDDGGSMPPPPPVDPTAVALTDELNGLRNDLADMKAQVAQAAAAPASRAPQAPEAPPQPPEPATIIVLRNGRRLESTNYAVMDRTLWNFSARPVQKIPLQSVDVTASEQANAERGVEFSLPADSEK